MTCHQLHQTAGQDPISKRIDSSARGDVVDLIAHRPCGIALGLGCEVRPRARNSTTTSFPQAPGLRVYAVKRTIMCREPNARNAVERSDGQRVYIGPARGPCDRDQVAIAPARTSPGRNALSRHTARAEAHRTRRTSLKSCRSVGLKLCRSKQSRPRRGWSKMRTPPIRCCTFWPSQSRAKSVLSALSPSMNAVSWQTPSGLAFYRS
jgi:hypothetical protein